MNKEIITILNELYEEGKVINNLKEFTKYNVVEKANLKNVTIIKYTFLENYGYLDLKNYIDLNELSLITKKVLRKTFKLDSVLIVKYPNNTIEFFRGNGEHNFYLLDNPILIIDYDFNKLTSSLGITTKDLIVTRTEVLRVDENREIKEDVNSRSLRRITLKDYTPSRYVKTLKEVLGNRKLILEFKKTAYKDVKNVGNYLIGNKEGIERKEVNSSLRSENDYYIYSKNETIIDTDIEFINSTDRNILITSFNNKEVLRENREYLLINVDTLKEIEY